MKFNYKLQRLCGAYYGHPATNSASAQQRHGRQPCVHFFRQYTPYLPYPIVFKYLDLQTHTVQTLPLEARSNICCMALSPDDALLLVVDVQNHALLVNFHRGIVLHRLKFKRKVRQALFSPNGQYIAVTHGKHVQVWHAPHHGVKEFMPLVLHRTYTGQRMM